MIRSATISEDGVYRYLLTRIWDNALPMLVFVMLNPSTADGETDDATVRACIAISKSQGCGGIVVVNLFAFRATAPSDMKAAKNPVGPKNDKFIAEVMQARPKMVIAAWGANGDYMNRCWDVSSFIRIQHEMPLYCLGETIDGYPKHPLARGKHRIPSTFIPYIWRDAP